MLSGFSNLHAFQRDPLGLFTRLSEQDPSLTFFDLGVCKAVLASSGEAVAAVLTHPDFDRDVRAFGPLGSFRAFSVLQNFIGRGLPVLAGQEGLERRRWIQPAFSTAQQQFITQPPETATTRFLSLLEEQPSLDDVDLNEVLARLVFEQLCSVMFGAPYRDASREMTRAMEVASGALHRLSARYTPWTHILGGRDARAVRQARATLIPFAERILTDLARLAKQPGPLPAAFAGLDLQALSPQHRLDEVVSQLVAGTETTTLSACWNTLLLSTHPEWWEAARLDAENTPARELRRRALSSPQVLNQCLREGMRLYPSFWQFLRVAQRDTTLLGHPVPEGSIAFISPYLTQRDPRRLQHPDRYEPGRRDGEKAAVAENLVFGYGSRSCIGGRLAISMLLDVMAAVLTTVTLEPLSTERKVDALFFGLRRVGGFRFKVRHRTAQA